MSLLKRLAIVLSAILIYESTAIPLAQAMSLPTVLYSPQLSDISNSQIQSHALLAIPRSVGKVVKVVNSPADSREIFHIQDIHDNTAAQTNLAEIVSVLAKQAKTKGKMLLVAVEGVSGAVDSDALASHPNKIAKEKVAAAMLRSGLLLGEEYAALTNNPGLIQLVGIESPQLYQRNVIARESSISARTRVLKTVREIKSQLEKLSPHNFKTLLADMEAKRAQVSEGTMGLTSYLTFLESINAQALMQSPRLQALMRVVHLESQLNQSHIQRETDEVLKELVKNADSKTLKGLMNEAQVLREGHIAPYVFYARLLSRTSRPAPALRQYLAYLTSVESAANEDVLEDIERAEESIAAPLINHPMARSLYTYLRWIDRQEKFFSLNMVPAEWKAQRGVSIDEILKRTAAMRAFVDEQTQDLGYTFRTPEFERKDLAVAVQGARTFYEAAEARDGVMALNLKKLLKDYSADRYDVALIAGGFHTPGLENELGREGLGYIIVRPELETDIKLDETYHFPTRKELTAKSHVSFLRPQEFMANPARRAALKAAIDQPEAGISLMTPKASRTLGVLGAGLLTYFLSQAGAGAAALTQVAGKTAVDSASTLSPLAFVSITLAGFLVVFGYGFYKFLGFDQDIQNITLTKKIILIAWCAAGKYGIRLGGLLFILRILPAQFTWSAVKNIPLLLIMIGFSTACLMIMANPLIIRWAYKIHLLSEEKKTQLALENGEVLNGLSRRGQLDLDKLAMAQTYIATLNNKPAFFSFDANGITMKSSHVLIPARMIERDGNFSIGQWTQLIGKSETGKKWLQVRIDAQAKRISMSELNSQRLNDIYLSQLNAKINDPKFQQEVVLNYAKELLDGEIDKLNFSELATDAKLRERVSVLIPYFLENWFRIAHGPDAEARKVAEAKISKLIYMMSGVPEDMDSDAITGYVPPTVQEKIKDRDLESDRKQLELMVLRGEIVHRFFAGGAARRLAPGKPAALVTPRDILEMLKKDGPVNDIELPDFPDVAAMGRYLMQIRASVEEIAIRNGWDPAVALANQTILMPTNSQFAPAFIDHLTSWEVNYYGFQPHNILLLEQRSGFGFIFKDGEFVSEWDRSKEAEEGPYGHGDIEFKHNMPGEAYYVAPDKSRHYIWAPLHALFGSLGKVYSHHQVSFNGAMAPGWVHDVTRWSAAFQAWEEGKAGTFEWRLDETGVAGGKVGYSAAFPPESAAYLHKKAGIFMVEDSMLQVNHGAAIQKKLAGAGSNSGTVIITARELHRVVNPALFPLIAKVRSEDGKRLPSVDPDTWSFFYGNMLNVELVTPVGKRRELKKPEHGKIWIEDTRKQDSPETNPFYFATAYDVQSRINQIGFKKDAVGKLRNARFNIDAVKGGYNEFSGKDARNISSRGLLRSALFIALAGIVIAIVTGPTHIEISPRLVIALTSLITGAFLSFLSLLGVLFQSGNVRGLLRERVEDRQVNRLLSSAVLSLTESLGVSVELSTEQLGRSKALNQIEISSALLAKFPKFSEAPVRFIFSLAVWPFRLLLTSFVLAHESVHAKIRTRSADIDEAIAYPVGILLGPVVFLGLLIASLIHITRFISESFTGGSSTGSEGRTFVERTVRTAISAADQKRNQLRAALKASINSNASAQSPDTALVFVNVASLVRMTATPQQLEAQLKTSLGIIMDLHRLKSENNLQSTLVFMNDDATLAGIESSLVQAIKGDAQFQYAFVGHEKLARWDGKDLGFVARQAGLEVMPPSTFLLSGDQQHFEGAVSVEVQTISHMAIAAFAYAHYRAAAPKLAELIRIFQKFDVQILDLATQIQAHTLALLAA